MSKRSKMPLLLAAGTLGVGCVVVLAVVLAIVVVPAFLAKRAAEEISDLVDEGSEATGERCPDGSHVFMAWEGEYPGPVVSVASKVQLLGRGEPCQETASIACTVPIGLYHPWGDQGAGFATIRGVDRFNATKDRKLWDGEVAAGDQVEVIGYFGEGFCLYRAGGKEIQGECPGMIPDDGLVEVPTPDVTEIQAFQVKCDNGVQAWIDVDDALWAIDGVNQGAITGYGEVSASGDSLI
jgi:hypothetical protein